MKAFPHITFVFDRKSTASKTKTAIIEVRISYERKQKYISTGIKVLPNQWKNGRIVNCPDSLQLNQLLDTMLTNIRQIIIDMSNRGHIDIFSISRELQKMKMKELSFIDFCRQRSEVRKYGKSPDTQERYNRFIRLFSAYGKIESFEDITDRAIIDYDKYLMKAKLKANSRWTNYHRFLNSFILDAINAGLLSRNPYKWINIDKKQESTGRHLTPEEFSRIRKAQMPTKSIEKVRDLFVFQTYTCMSYADLRDFSSDGIREIKGMKVYIGNRQKTKKNFTIPLLPEALRILEKYDNTLPIISNVKYNEYLKIVAQAAGIDKPLSTHWARHTGATLLLNEGVDMKIVSKICGHSSTRITEQVYAKLLDETVVDAIKNSFDLHRQKENH